MPESDEDVQIQVEQVLGFRLCLWQIRVVRAILAAKDVITMLQQDIPPSRIDEIMANLHLREDHTSIFRLSTDRPNIFFVVHKMQNPVGSYHDLAFVIKQHMSEGEPLPPNFLIPVLKHKLVPNFFDRDWLRS